MNTIGEGSTDSQKEKKCIHILLIEDDKISQRLIQGFLRKEDYQITHVENGEEAFKIMHERSFDLILSDMEMPVINGYEISHTIKHNPKWEKIAFLTPAGCG